MACECVCVCVCVCDLYHVTLVGLWEGSFLWTLPLVLVFISVVEIKIFSP